MYVYTHIQVTPLLRNKNKFTFSAGDQMYPFCVHQQFDVNVSTLPKGQMCECAVADSEAAIVLLQIEGLRMCCGGQQSCEWAVENSKAASMLWQPAEL